MKNYIYQNKLIGKKELRQLLAWSFTNYDSMHSCILVDELKYLGFKYSTQAGISISIEDLKVPFVKTLILEKANQDIQDAEKIYLKGKITDVERFQKIIDTWSLTSESLKDQIIYYFKNYDPLNSVYIMAFSGARGNLSQVRQLVGMRGLMSDPSGQILNLPIKKNFREGLTITDYLMSGYGARKGIVDTALKTANSGYLTRRLIDVAQDILIREKDCFTNNTFLFSVFNYTQKQDLEQIYKKILGRVLKKAIYDPKTKNIIAEKNTEITLELIKTFKKNKITQFYVRSPLTCNLYRAICQTCYGWDLANEILIDIGEAIGILAGQSIGEPGTQLTMRTFHTGGIFTSETRQQILSPFNGIIQFYKCLKIVLLRTNRGEDVFVTKNSGFLILIPNQKDQKLFKIDVLRNTILFPKNNQYILKDTVIGELINTNKQIKTEIKAILSNTGGEIFIPRLKQKINLVNNNKLIWILAGQLYNSPINSFLNFYSDYKLNAYSYIFRTKVINHDSGFVHFINNIRFIYQQILYFNNKKYSLPYSTLYKLDLPIEFHTFFLEVKGFKYLIKIQKKKSTNYIEFLTDKKLGIFLTNSFRTLTGGTLYYDILNRFQTANISYFERKISRDYYYSIWKYRGIIWLEEEIYQVNCEQKMLLVEQGDFISKHFELIPGLFSRTSGFVTLIQKNQIIKIISIKSGLIYEGNKFKTITKKLYYPGECLFSNVTVNKLSFCEQIIRKNIDQLLVRPIYIYEFPRFIQTSLNKTSNLQLRYLYSYCSNQPIYSTKPFNLVSIILMFESLEKFNTNNIINIWLRKNKKKQWIDFHTSEKLVLRNHLKTNLCYQKIQSCFLVQKNQFINKYMILGYLETMSLNFLEVVKFKIRKQNIKQIFLISNKDCLNISKNKSEGKKVNDFITSKSNIRNVGKVIIENDKVLTLQKGQLYFFPNCKNQNSQKKMNLQYKFLPTLHVNSFFQTNKKILLNYYNINKLIIFKKTKLDSLLELPTSLKLEFSKLFIKKKGKLYSCLMPQFFKKITVNSNPHVLKFKNLLNSQKLSCKKKIDQTLLIHNSELLKNHNKFSKNNKITYQLTLVRFVEQPFLKSTKSIGLYSITEDLFEQEGNSIFCKNHEFIEAGTTLGLLNLEKEITGDIVQGLPRIEEILEARKKNILLKQIPTSKKKGLLLQKTSLDPNFDFKKLGTTVQENDKINPHKLLKVYFNYYGLSKYFLCDQSYQLNYSRLLQNYESSYKSFKKIQLFILNSVQSVYQSQGVLINDKHLEVIIKQMTTKVLITYEGNTPLLRREVIDLYHIKYINKIISIEKKQVACYIPLLLGITKAALNNPSFISAASFQETTRVLMMAGIEGRIDWLRGLKENIIIGHLIPSGTGYQNYNNCFKVRAATKFNPIYFN